MERYQFLRNHRNAGTRQERKRADNQNHQKNKRDALLEQQRWAGSSTVQKEPPKPAEPAKKSRLELLKEWKQKKEVIEKERKQSKRPPFYAGKLLTSATGSPIRRPMVNIDSNVPRRAGVVTRSQAAGRNASKTFSKPQPVMTGIKKIVGEKLKGVTGHKFGFLLTVPESPRIKKSARKRGRLIDAKSAQSEPDTVSKKTKSKKTLDIPTVNNEENFADLGVARIIYSPSIPTPAAKFTHLEYSPNITVGRGNKRRSSGSDRKSLRKNFDVDEEIKKEENIKTARIHEFRLFLLNETSRLMGLAAKWADYVQNEPAMPEDAAGDANAVIGKSKLLTSDKFKQFADIITKCEGGDPKIKVDDLFGFHDWVSLEVEDLDKVYMGLEERRKMGWVTDEKSRNMGWVTEEKSIETAEPVKKQAKQKLKKPVSKPAGGRSALMALIQAKRKMMQQNENVQNSNVVPDKEASPVEPVASPRPCSEPAAATADPVISPRHAMCMKAAVVSPGRTSTPRDNRSLRVELLRQSTGLHVLAATAMARLSLSPLASESALPSPVQTTVTLKTPQRSILKKSALSSAKTKSVGFGIDEKYFMPCVSENSDDSPEILDLMKTPVRRSSRLANRSMDKGLRV